MDNSFFSTDHWNSGEVDLFPENGTDSSDDNSSDSDAEFGNYLVTPMKAAGVPREQANPPETLSQRLQAAFDEVALMSSHNNATNSTEPSADSEDVLGAVAATVEMREHAVKKKRQEIDAGKKLVAVHYVLHKKYSKHDTIRKMATEYRINIQHIQLTRWIRDVKKIHQAWTTQKKRIPGGGTKRLGVRNGTESATLTWYEERRARGERTRFIDIRRELGTRDNPVSVFAATTFLKHHNLRLRSATIKTVLGQDEIETLVQHFLTSCHHVNKLNPQLTCENIVQMDEVATTMWGFMKAPMSLVQNHDDSPCSSVQTCDLDSDKKLCTGLHFLSAVL
jgi:hypothetical protein